jgi:hypothetical protein
MTLLNQLSTMSQRHGEVGIAPYFVNLAPSGVELSATRFQKGIIFFRCVEFEVIIAMDMGMCLK